MVCIDTFYIVNLKGVGKLWQLTACDAASSFAMAKVIPANNAKEAASFLRDVVVVEVDKAGCRLWRVLAETSSDRIRATGLRDGHPLRSSGGAVREQRHEEA